MFVVYLSILCAIQGCEGNSGSLRIVYRRKCRNEGQRFIKSPNLGAAYTAVCTICLIVRTRIYFLQSSIIKSPALSPLWDDSLPGYIHIKRRYTLYRQSGMTEIGVRRQATCNVPPGIKDGIFKQVEADLERGQRLPRLTERLGHGIEPTASSLGLGLCWCASRYYCDNAQIHKFILEAKVTYITRRLVHFDKE